jgi:hypothetical protein
VKPGAAPQVCRTSCPKVCLRSPKQLAREIWTPVLCELDCLVGLSMTQFRGSGEAEGEREEVNQAHKRCCKGDSRYFSHSSLALRV